MSYSQKQPQNRIRDLILQYCKEEGLQDTYYALRRESGLGDEEDDSFDAPDSLENLYGLRQAVELFDAMKQSEASAPSRRFANEIKSLLSTSTTSYRAEAKKPLVVKRKERHDYIHKANILAVVSHPNYPHIVATTAADKRICITNLKTKTIICVVTPTDDERMPSVALSLDFHPKRSDLLLVGYINGTVSLFQLPTFDPETKTDSEKIPEAVLVQSWKQHEKFTIAVQFDVDGFGFVSGAHDNKVAFFKPKMQSTDGSESSVPEYECVKEIVFKGQVEALTRMYTRSSETTTVDEPSTTTGEDAKTSTELPRRTFAVSIRGDNNILFLDLDSADVVGQVNMNSVGDDHVSFTALSLACSPRGQLLLAATDSHRVILFHIPSRSIIRNYYGANNGDMSAPRVCWAPCGDMTSILCTGQDNVIHVWDSHTQRHMGKSLENHVKRLRDFTVSATDNTLYSVSFDQTLVEWVIEE